MLDLQTHHDQPDTPLITITVSTSSTVHRCPLFFWYGNKYHPYPGRIEFEDLASTLCHNGETATISNLKELATSKSVRRATKGYPSTNAEALEAN